MQWLTARTGGKGNHRLERTALGERVQEVARNRGLHLALCDVHDRSIARDFDRLGHRAHLEPHIDIRQAADRQVNADLLEGAESGHRHRQGVDTRGQLRNTVPAGIIGLHFPGSQQGSA